MRHKPSFLFQDEETDKGMQVLEKYFVQNLGYDIELVKTLVIKYPYILNKTVEDLDKTFEILA